MHTEKGNLHFCTLGEKVQNNIANNNLEECAQERGIQHQYAITLYIPVLVYIPTHCKYSCLYSS